MRAHVRPLRVMIEAHEDYFNHDKALLHPDLYHQTIAPKFGRHFTVTPIPETRLARAEWVQF